MAEINLMDLYPQPKRNVDARANERTPEDVRLAKLFGKEFFDGPRIQGYGGFKYDGRWVPVVKRWAEHYGLKAGDSVLDVGCAKGFTVYDLMHQVPGIKVAGIDVSQYAIDNAMPEARPFLQVANAKKLPYPDKSFDFVFSINSIHNLPLEECKQALREMERVSRKHKFIVVDAWYNDEEKERLKKWILTAETYMHVNDWVKLFKEVGYTGDYWWFIP